jgi:hypothetical protein
MKCFSGYSGGNWKSDGKIEALRYECGDVEAVLIEDLRRLRIEGRRRLSAERGSMCISMVKLLADVAEDNTLGPDNGELDREGSRESAYVLDESLLGVAGLGSQRNVLLVKTGSTESHPMSRDSPLVNVVSVRLSCLMLWRLDSVVSE